MSATIKTEECSFNLNVQKQLTNDDYNTQINLIASLNLTRQIKTTLKASELSYNETQIIYLNVMTKKIKIPRPVGVYMCLSVAANFTFPKPGYE